MVDDGWGTPVSFTTCKGVCSFCLDSSSSSSCTKSSSSHHSLSGERSLSREERGVASPDQPGLRMSGSFCREVVSLVVDEA